MRLYLMRHAQSTNNATDVNDASRFQGRLPDAPLTDIGYEQAQIAAKWLWDYSQTVQSNNSTHGHENISAILCSPMIRALQTAEELIKVFTNIPVFALPELCEVGGLFSGPRKSPRATFTSSSRNPTPSPMEHPLETPCTIKETLTPRSLAPPASTRSDPPSFPLPGCSATDQLHERFPFARICHAGPDPWWNQDRETNEQATERAWSVVKTLWCYAASNPKATILIITHGLFQDLLLKVFLTATFLRPEQWPSSTAMSSSDCLLFSSSPLDIRSRDHALLASPKLWDPKVQVQSNGSSRCCRFTPPTLPPCFTPTSCPLHGTPSSKAHSTTASSPSTGACSSLSRDDDVAPPFCPGTLCRPPSSGPELPTLLCSPSGDESQNSTDKSYACESQDGIDKSHVYESQDKSFFLCNNVGVSLIELEGPLHASQKGEAITVSNAERGMVLGTSHRSNRRRRSSSNHQKEDGDGHQCGEDVCRTLFTTARGNDGSSSSSCDGPDQCCDGPDQVPSSNESPQDAHGSDNNLSSSLPVSMSSEDALALMTETSSVATSSQSMATGHSIHPTPVDAMSHRSPSEYRCAVLFWNVHSFLTEPRLLLSSGQSINKFSIF